MLKNQSQFNVFFFNDSNQSRSRSRSISFCWFLGGFVLLYAPLGRPHGVCPPRRASQWPYKVIGSSFDISYACCTWYMALLDYTILYYSVSSVLSCLPFLQNPVCATTHDLLTTQQPLRCLTMCSVVFVGGASLPRSAGFHATTACSSGSRADRWYLLPSLHSNVIVFPPTDNRRSDAADHACTARYLRTNLATLGVITFLQNNIFDQAGIFV